MHQREVEVFPFFTPHSNFSLVCFPLSLTVQFLSSLSSLFTSTSLWCVSHYPSQSSSSVSGSVLVFPSFHNHVGPWRHQLLLSTKMNIGQAQKSCVPFFTPVAGVSIHPSRIHLILLSCLQTSFGFCSGALPARNEADPVMQPWA